MTVSTDGQICFGIKFEDGAEFPWGDQYFEDWWFYDACGYKNPYELYDEKGEYIDGTPPTEERDAYYYDKKYEFEAAHPPPIALVNYCSGDFQMYILAIPHTILFARRGYPTFFDPAILCLTESQMKIPAEFCKKHGIEVHEPARWWLSSLWMRCPSGTERNCDGHTKDSGR